MSRATDRTIPGSGHKLVGCATCGRPMICYRSIRLIWCSDDCYHERDPYAVSPMIRDGGPRPRHPKKARGDV